MLLLSRRVVQVHNTPLFLPLLTTTITTPITATMPKRRAAASATTTTTSAPALKRAKSTAATTTAATASTEIGEQGEDENGNPFWEIGGRLRRVGISEFKGKHLVSIREYYEKDGKMLPGRKGISLSVEQLNNLVSILPQIEEQLAGKGVVVERPEYGAAAPAVAAPAEDGEEGDDSAEEEVQDEPVIEEEEEDEEDEEEAKKKKKRGRKSKP